MLKKLMFFLDLKKIQTSCFKLTVRPTYQPYLSQNALCELHTTSADTFTSV